MSKVIIQEVVSPGCSHCATAKQILENEIKPKFPDAKIELMEDQGVRATLIEVGQTRLELLEPTSPESGVGRFIERRGEGLHHLAFNVTDISGKLQTLRTLGVDLIDQTPREGLSGTIAFVHPRSVFGILTELVESNPD